MYAMGSLTVVVFLVTVGILSVVKTYRSNVTTVSRNDKPSYVDCNFFHANRTVYCRGSSSIYRAGPCSAVKAAGKGPAPIGKYKIGVHKIHKNVDWYNMFQWSPTKHIYYDYYRVNPETGRSYIAFHVGTFSLGCVTVSEKCYKKRLRPQIQMAKPTQTVVEAKIGTRLFNKTVQTIGYMHVH